MRIIQFKKPNDEKILRGEKTMTARFWRKQPPMLSEIVRAQTGRRKDSSFATIQITGLWIWDPFTQSLSDIEERLGYSIGEIAQMEGFKTWQDFMDAYISLNQHHDSDDEKRTHYFIAFELVRNLRSQNELF